MGFLDQLKKAGQDTVTIAKDLTEAAKLNMSINENERQIEKLFAQMGRLYYEIWGKDPDERFAEAITEISQLQAENAEYTQQTQVLKSNETCSGCGAPLELGAGFCSHCGTKRTLAAESESEVDAEGKISCPSCGKFVEQKAFCNGCGEKLPTQ